MLGRSHIEAAWRRGYYNRPNKCIYSIIRRRGCIRRVYHDSERPPRPSLNSHTQIYTSCIHSLLFLGSPIFSSPSYLLDLQIHVVKEEKWCKERHIREDLVKEKRLYIYTHNSQSNASVIPKYLFAVFHQREKG